MFCVAGSSIEMVPVYQSRVQLTDSVGKVLAERVIYLCKYKCHLHKYLCNGHSITDKTKILMTNGSLMKVESIAECSHWSILQYH